MIKKFPTQIRVSRGKLYEVHWTQAFPNDPKKVGECHPVSRVITLKLNESEEDTWWTLFHEIVHAINFEAELGLTEKQVTRLEKSLVSIFRSLGWKMGGSK